jgi:hypothetical protein
MSTQSSNDSQTQNAPTQSAERPVSTESGVESLVTDTKSDENIDVTLDLDNIFGILKNQRRQRILRYLTTHDGEVTIGTLSEHIAALEQDTTPAALTWRERKRVYIGLLQCHLPKLDDVNAIEFNKARGIIERGPTAAQFEPYLEFESQETPVWSRYYLLLAGIGWLVFVTQYILLSGIGPPLSQLFVSIIGSFILLSAVHLYCTAEWKLEL